jgi:hypothetical protein
VVDSKFGSSWGKWCSNEHFGRMGWGYGRILGGVEGCFQVIADLRWEVAQRLVSGMACAVGRWMSLSRFSICTLLE